MAKCLGWRKSRAGSDSLENNFQSKRHWASAYGNLGSIARDQGDLTKAREIWTTARDLFAKIGSKHRVDEVQGWLDRLPD